MHSAVTRMFNTQLFYTKNSVYKCFTSFMNIHMFIYVLRIGQWRRLNIYIKIFAKTSLLTYLSAFLLDVIKAKKRLCSR